MRWNWRTQIDIHPGDEQTSATLREFIVNLRYAQSGHLSRQAEREARSVPPSSRVRLAVVASAILLPGVIGVLVTGSRDASASRIPAEALATTVSAGPSLPIAGPPAANTEGGAIPAEVSEPADLASPAPALATRTPTPLEAGAAAGGSARGPRAAGASPTVVRVVDALRANEALSSALARHCACSDDVSALVQDLKDHLQVRSLRPGLTFMVETSPAGTGDVLSAFELRTVSAEGAPRRVRADRKEKASAAEEVSFQVEVADAPIETVVEGISGVVRTSLYQALLDAGEDANLVNKFVDVFAWNVDFYRQTQRGDEFRVLVEKRFAGNAGERRFLGYGRVLAAEYVNDGAIHRGFLFHSKDGKHVGTYDEGGTALQRTFLKSPMAIANVTSSYGMRFHPVLGQNKKHEGVDYGAPLGTPVWTVADGVVLEAHYSKTAGNMVRVQHANGISTEYFHLSKWAEGLKPGNKVAQKQVIGAVGNTGMSTGPHLHFGMLRGGVYVDPQKQNFPNSKPVPKEYRNEFQKFMEPLLMELRGLGRV